jgi:hypothetical protein
MAALAFLLECAATAALIGLAVSLLVWPTLLVLRGRALQRVPALRADLAFVLGTLPALASVGGGPPRLLLLSPRRSVWRLTTAWVMDTTYTCASSTRRL